MAMSVVWSKFEFVHFAFVSIWLIEDDLGERKAGFGFSGQKERELVFGV